MNNFKIGAFVTGGIILFGVILTPFFVTTIGAGHAGVVYNRNGGLEQQTLGQGWHLVSPFKRVTEYPIATETVKYEDVTIGTKDGKPIKTTFQYNYHIEPTKLPDIFNKFRGANSEVIENGFLKSRLTEMAKEVTTKYTVLEILGEKSSEVSLGIQEKFAVDAKEIGFIVEAVTFTPPVPDEQTQKAIQAKVDAQQKLEQEKVELEKAKVIAQKQREEAKGKADSVLIEAEGQAKANQVIRQSLTNELVQYETVKKWNGTLPQVSGSNTPIVQLPTANTSK
ncbi:prohibitin family protein [Paenibacillus sp. EKM208P]|nr:prohibitin family protein [Paenibacillus sp. EKM208P]